MTRCCERDCSGRKPGCHDRCGKYQAWAAALKAEKAALKAAVDRDRVSAGDFEKEGWMAKKGQRRRRKR